MKFLRTILLLLLLESVVFANIYRDMVKISLKKDESKKILVKYDTIQKVFKFRWTLFVNEGLVIHRSYDNFVSQNILYLNHKNQSFRVKLRSGGADHYNVPYILVKFVEFDYENNEADFELYLSDKKMLVRLEYLENE